MQEALRYILGTILNNPDLLPEVDIKLDDLPVQYSTARAIWQGILNLYARNELPTPAAVAAISGVPVAGILALQRYNDPANLTDYVAEVLRAINDNKLAELKAAISTAKSIHDIEQAVVAAKQSYIPPPVAGSISKLADQAVANYVELQAVNESQRTIKWPIAHVNELTGGLHKKQMNILAARPGMGKSALAAQVRRAALQDGKVVVSFSIDMDALRLVNRDASAALGINVLDITLGRLTDDDFQRYLEFIRQVKQYEHLLYMYDVSTIPVGPGQSMLDGMYGILHAVYASTGRIDLIHLDYIQKLDLGTDNRANEVGLIAKEINRFTKLFNATALLEAQLNRGVEQRQDPRPRPSDLRDSGTLEQEADVILFPFRDFFYDNNADPKDAEINIAKNRNGPTGVAYCCWDGPTFTFYDTPIVTT